MLPTISGMRTKQPRFKQTQVFTWESEPVDERPSEFGVFEVISTYGRSSDFSSSSFMNAAPHRPARQRNRRSARPLRAWILGMLCLVLVIGVVGVWQGRFA